MELLRRAGEYGHDDVGTVAPHDGDDVGKNGIARPMTERFLRCLRVAEVVRSREELARAVERIADLSTNIAENVIFAVGGRDVRHTRAE